MNERPDKLYRGDHIPLQMNEATGPGPDMACVPRSLRLPHLPVNPFAVLVFILLYEPVSLDFHAPNISRII